ncbi:hypothetical protein, partial [Caballeronia glathei]|uniref:hypothetical protein n=1 Tax=Caballeronia glathei TaxID=60547 RepID=UPI001E56C179
QPNRFQLEFERVARPLRLAHLLDSPCLSLNAQQGIRFSGASSEFIMFSHTWNLKIEFYVLAYRH